MKREILVKFGEIFLKGENKEKFENALFVNLRKKIDKFGNYKIKKMGSVFAISGENTDLILDVIKKTFGIVSFAHALKVNKNMDDIKNAAAEEVKNTSCKTFKIEAKRADKGFSNNSFEICAQVGAFISENFDLRVDVHNPDLVIKVEIRNSAYVYSRNISGAGGLPSGTSGLGTVMISGGIDSPVAAFMMAKED